MDRDGVWSEWEMEKGVGIYYAYSHENKDKSGKKTVTFWGFVVNVNAVKVWCDTYSVLNM